MPSNAAASSSAQPGPAAGLATGPAPARQPSDKGKERDPAPEAFAPASAGPDAKREAEFKKRDKTLGELMVMLDEYKPLVRVM